MLRVIVKNAGSNALVMVVKICFSFIMAPVIVHALGNYDYGLWEIVFSLIGYMGLMDIGMRPAVTRYVAKFKAENDRTKLDQVFSTAVVFNATVGTVCCCALFLWAYFRPELLAETAGASSERYVFFLVIIGIQIFFQFPGYIAECFHMGYQRYFLKNNITLLNTVVGNVILYNLLTDGYGLLTLALGNAIGISIKYVVYFLLLRCERYGSYSFDFRFVDVATLKILLSFGVKSFVAGISGTISSSVSTVVIGVFLGPGIVPFYTIPARLISYVGSLSMTVSNVFMPMFSQINAQGEKKKVVELYLTSTKFIFGFTLPMIIGCGFLGVPFIKRWIGSEYAVEGETVLYLLTVGSFFYMVNPLFARFLTGIGEVDFLAKIRVASTIILTVLCVVLVQFAGKEGVAFAYCVSSLIVLPIELWYSCRSLHISWLYFVRSVYLRLLVPGCTLMGMLSFITYRFILETYWSLLITVFITGCIYLLFFVLFSLTSKERSLMIDKFAILLPGKV